MLGSSPKTSEKLLTGTDVKPVEAETHSFVFQFKGAVMQKYMAPCTFCCSIFISMLEKVLESVDFWLADVKISQSALKYRSVSAHSVNH